VPIENPGRQTFGTLWSCVGLYWDSYTFYKTVRLIYDGAFPVIYLDIVYFGRESMEQTKNVKQNTKAGTGI
jgi:hypothetical protein